MKQKDKAYTLTRYAEALQAMRALLADAKTASEHLLIEEAIEKLKKSRRARLFR